MIAKPKIASTASEDLYARALQVMPGGCSRNTVLKHPHPLYVSSGEGCYVTDIQGVSRIDFANNMASLIHGHAHPRIVRAVSEQLQRGTAFTMATEQEIVYAEEMCERVNAFENIRFVNFRYRSRHERAQGIARVHRTPRRLPKWKVRIMACMTSLKSARRLLRRIGAGKNGH